uniref:hypothetical protein n=1 Tax=uncultured Erythrobacter sp. TaxID=263913 RepID=UPI00261BF515|nr:hypothetical protein [uncultured Erythrobacter sp.]
MSEPAILGQLHFWIGCAAIVAGFAAFAARKGQTVHIVSGRVFVVTMALLALSGLWLSFARGILFTVFLSALAFHLIITAWATAATHNSAAHLVTKFSFVGSGAIFLGSIAGAWITAHSVAGMLNGLTPEAFLIIAGVALIIAIYDFIFAYGSTPSERSRLGRHLWRMGFAFFLATGIFFFGNNHVLPEAFRTVAFLSAPVVAVVLWTAFFAVKTRFFSGSEKT